MVASAVVVLEVALGKRCARLDLRQPADRELFKRLLSEADVLVHGYRPDEVIKLARFDADHRRKICPGLVDVTLDAYGWAGPWKGRRGFDSLVQMSSGIAEAGMRQLSKNNHADSRFQALDHSVGYFLAAAAIRGLINRFKTGAGFEARTSLVRMAALLSITLLRETSRSLLKNRMICQKILNRRPGDQLAASNRL